MSFAVPVKRISIKWGIAYIGISIVISLLVDLIEYEQRIKNLDDHDDDHENMNDDHDNVNDEHDDEGGMSVESG